MVDYSKVEASSDCIDVLDFIYSVLNDSCLSPCVKVLYIKDYLDKSFKLIKAD